MMDEYLKKLIQNESKYYRILSVDEFDTLTVGDLVAMRIESSFTFDFPHKYLIDNICRNVERVLICRDTEEHKQHVFRPDNVVRLNKTVNPDLVLSMKVKDFVRALGYQAVHVGDLFIASRSYQTVTDIADPEERFSQALAIRARELLNR